MAIAPPLPQQHGRTTDAAAAAASAAANEAGRRSGPLLMSGGRNCVANTNGIFLWENSNGMAGANGGDATKQWKQHSITAIHNALWKGVSAKSSRVSVTFQFGFTQGNRRQLSEGCATYVFVHQGILPTCSHRRSTHLLTGKRWRACSNQP